MSAKAKQVSADVATLVADLYEVKVRRAALEDREKELRTAILAHVGDLGGEWEVGDYLLRVQAKVRAFLDEKGIREKYPDVAAEFAKSTAYTAVTVTETKEARVDRL